MSLFTLRSKPYLSRQEVLEEMSYAICTAPSKTKLGQHASRILDIKRKNFIDDVPGNFIKYRKRYMASDRRFIEILSVFRAAENNKDLQLILSMDISVLMAIDYIKNIGEGVSLDSDAGMVFLTIWNPFLAYIRETDRERLLDVLKEFPNSEPLIETMNTILDVSDLFFVFSDESTDKFLMNNLENNEFYAYCRKNLPNLLSEARSLRYTVTSVAAFHKNNHVFVGSDLDWTDLEEMEKQMTEQDRKSSVLSPDYDKDVMSVPTWRWVKFFIMKSIQKEADIFALNGIDVNGFLSSSDFSAKDISDIIKQAFVYCNKRYGFSGYKKRKEQSVLIETVVRLWLFRAIGNRYEELIKASKAKSKESSNSDAKKLIDKLKKENAELKRKQTDASEEVVKAVKAKDQSIKSLQAELASLRSELKDRDSEIVKLKDEIEDVKQICEDMTAEEPEEEPEEAFSDEFFRSYIQSHKVIMWGLRDDVRARIEKMYPEMIYLESDRSLTRQQLQNCDVFIMNTSFTNHAKYWAARDMVKNMGIPIVQLRKTACHPSKIVEALDIALGRN